MCEGGWRLARRAGPGWSASIISGRRALGSGAGELVILDDGGALVLVHPQRLHHRQPVDGQPARTERTGNLTDRHVPLVFSREAHAHWSFKRRAKRRST